MKESKINPLALLQFGGIPFLVLVFGLFMYFDYGDFLTTDFVIKESYPHHDRYPDCVWGSDLYVSFGDGRFGLYYESGENKGLYSLHDRRKGRAILLHITKAEQRKNIIRLWDKRGKVHVLDFLAPTLDGRCIECGRIHFGGMCAFGVGR